MAQTIIKSGIIKIDIPNFSLNASSSKTLNMGDYGLPLGSYRLINAFMGNYCLPYIGSEGTTYVESYNASTRNLLIRNTGGEWSNYVLTLLFLKI